jgi:general secretion pathway protein D
VEITPKVHQGGEVTLKVSIDVSSVTSFSNIGGISEPVIGQRKIEHEIRLKEGEANMMGGILEDSDTKSLSGFPGLAKIPILRYFFAQSDTERKENEIVFVLTPHIVRGQELSDLNQRSLGVGTASAISLRRSTPPQTPAPSSRNGAPGGGPQAPANSGATNPAPQPVSQMSQPIQLQSPDTPPGNASFQFDPPSINQPQGATFAVNVLLNAAQNAYSVPLQVSYDPKILQVVNVSNGGFLSQDGQPVAVVHREDEENGTMQITATRPPGASGISGQGAVVTLTFLAKTPGQSTLTISKGGARDPGMQPIPVAGTAATVTVQ